MDKQTDNLREILPLIAVALIGFIFFFNLVLVPEIIDTQKTNKCIKNPPERLQSYCKGDTIHYFEDISTHSFGETKWLYTLVDIENYYNKCIEDKCQIGN